MKRAMKQNFEQNLANLEGSNPSLYKHIREFAGSRTGKIMADRIAEVDNCLKSALVCPEEYDENFEKSVPLYPGWLLHRRGSPSLYGSPEMTLNEMYTDTCIRERRLMPMKKRSSRGFFPHIKRAFLNGWEWDPLERPWAQDPDWGMSYMGPPWW